MSDKRKPLKKKKDRAKAADGAMNVKPATAAPAAQGGSRPK